MSIFNGVIKYILRCEGEGSARLFLNEKFLAASEQRPHQHSVVIVGCRDSGRIDATVRIFDGLCYSVNLSDQYEGADFVDTFVL